MANNEDVNQANSGAPAADIPDLKKKEKERKKAGAAWGGAKPGGGFSGATGGAGSAGARAAASAASSLGGGAAAGAAGAAQAAGAGWLSSMIASLTATVLGKAILAAGVAMLLAGGGLFAYAMLGGGGADGAGGIGDLGAIASSMKIRGDGGDRTGYIASNGEIMFDPLKAAEAKKAAEKAPEEKTADAAVPPAPPADASGGGAGGGFTRPGLEHNMSGTKLSSSLGGGFGGKSIFAGSSGAPKFNEGLAKSKIKGAEKGRLSASRASKTGRSVAGSKSKGFKSNKALGQLKVAKGMSTMGAGTAGAEGARTSAASAFDGATPGNGNVVGAPTDRGGGGGGTVTSPSGPGAPDMTSQTPTLPPGVNMDHDTAAALAGIAAMAKKAGEMKKKAAQLMMQGLALIVIGAIMMATLPFVGQIIGGILIALGGMLIGMSMMMSNMAEMMKGMADSMSEGLAARTSDVKQNQINKYCIDKAYNQGTDPKNCNPPESVTDNEKVKNDNKKATDALKDKKEKEEKTDFFISPDLSLVKDKESKPIKP